MSGTDTPLDTPDPDVNYVALRLERILKGNRPGHAARGSRVTWWPEAWS